jgi:dolichol-phosphate mannosyltransferase
MSESRKTVSLVIPTFNEERTIKEIIESTRPYADEILVVGAKKSKDRTVEIARGLGVNVVIDNGKGKGDALRVGIKEAKEDIVVFIDADGSHIPEDIPKLVKPIQEDRADMVIASRFLGGSDELYGSIDSFLRVFFSLIISQIINWRFNQKLADTQNGFRAIKRSVALNLGLRANSFDIETDLTMRCLKKKYRVIETASHERERKYGPSGISIFTTGWRFALRVFLNVF